VSKIQRVSFFFRVLFQVAFVVLLAAEILTWLNAPASLHALKVYGFFMIPENYFTNLAMPQHLMPQTFTAMTKLLGFLVSMISTGVKLVLFYFLIRLFKLYERGEIFTLANVRYIRNIGYTLLVSQLIIPLYQGLIGIVLTRQNPPGQHFAMFGIGTDNLGVLFMSLLIILVSWIMAEGCRLREEQQLTI
jgi:hypothetical protein